MEGWKIHDGSHLHPMLASDVVEVDLWNADLSSIFLSFFRAIIFCSFYFDFASAWSYAHPDTRAYVVPASEFRLVVCYINCHFYERNWSFSSKELTSRLSMAFRLFDCNNSISFNILHQHFPCSFHWKRRRIFFASLSNQNYKWVIVQDNKRNEITDVKVKKSHHLWSFHSLDTSSNAIRYGYFFHRRTSFFL